MKQLADGVWQLRGFPPDGINVYLVEDVLTSTRRTAPSRSPGRASSRRPGRAKAACSPRSSPRVRGPQHRRRGRLRVRRAARRERPGRPAGRRPRVVSHRAMSSGVGAQPATSSSLRLWLWGVAIGYVALSLAGVTTSSLGIQYLSETPRGERARSARRDAADIRIDEWNRGTPWLLGLMSRGDDGFASPLAFPDVALVAPTARDVPSGLLHWEAVAAKAAAVLPETLVFAAIWWFPVALVAALLPLWLSGSACVPRSPSLRRASSSSRRRSTGGRLARSDCSPRRSWAPSSPSLRSTGGGRRAPTPSRSAPWPWRRSASRRRGSGTRRGRSPSRRRSSSRRSPPRSRPEVGGRARLPRRRVSQPASSLAGLIVAQSNSVDVIAGTVYPGARRSLGEFVGSGCSSVPHTRGSSRPARRSLAGRTSRR